MMTLGMLMVAGCRDAPESAEAPDPALGHALPGLVFAANAPVFDTGDSAYTELVRNEDLWKIHHGGAWRADCHSEEEIYQAMRPIWNQDSGSRILISAAGDIAFREIRELIRGGARAGFWRVDFLVATGKRGGANHALCLKLPRMGWSPPEHEPFFIIIDAQGVVSSGTGASRKVLDRDPAVHALPKLNALLQFYVAAANAENCKPYCQVYADPESSYQRVIDLLSCFHANGIEEVVFTDIIEEPESPPSFKTKPRAPSFPPLRPDE